MLVEESSLLTNLQKFFGYESFKGDQEAIIKNVLEGRDTFVIMPTGG
jgi:ATP-dependent DNA helicase RecQ